jgi:hypothetical protein
VHLAPYPAPFLQPSRLFFAPLLVLLLFERVLFFKRFLFFFVG